ncbi:MAG: hypothetical protein JKY88_08860 [Pseudomonadales bacterium]|nr:hypothetical protein [Pseudomonadales bacterium]
MLLCAKAIDAFRTLPEEQWDILEATVPVYYLFPNIQLIPSGRNMKRESGKLGDATLVRVYPHKTDPNRSFSQVSFYTNPNIAESDRMMMSERLAGFSEVTPDEDYVAAATSHKGAQSGAINHFIFGRNEPALHHYHNNYNRELGLPPLDKVE